MTKTKDQKMRERFRKLKISGELTINDLFSTYRRDWKKELGFIEQFISEEIAKTEKKMIKVLKRIKLELDVCVCECG